MTNTFWGYPGADILAIIIISAASLAYLISARSFVKNYGN